MKTAIFVHTIYRAMAAQLITIAMTPQAPKNLYPYLAIRQAPQAADWIIGFGSFDMRVPVHCAHLYLAGHAPRVLFTGGVGGGSGKLTQPEALAFKQAFLQLIPDMPPEQLLIEPHSTHTGQNMAYSLQLLAKKELQDTLHRVLLVTTPPRQRRVYLTAKKHLPAARLFNCPPESHWQEDKEHYAAAGYSLDEVMQGEWERIQQYPANGFIVPDHPLPPA